MLPSCFAEAKMKLLKPVVCFILNSWGINVSFALTWNYVILNHKCCSATIQRALSKRHTVTTEVMTQKKILSMWTPSFFSIWKSLWVLQKARIKIVVHAIYTCLFFSYTYTLLFCWKIKSCGVCCFLQQIRLQITVQWYVLQDYSSVSIGFNMTNKCHTLPIIYTTLV